ncbi:hypothetical protein CTS44_09127 [Comamonas thiooxydans]|nr:hypothetical protein CTS44_09127 [Comamonas thiooxydans]
MDRRKEGKNYLWIFLGILLQMQQEQLPLLIYLEDGVHSSRDLKLIF